MSSVARSQSPFAGVFRRFVDRSRERTSVRMLWLICALAFGLRMFIAYYSIGTNDINTWKTFATLGLHGVTRVYALHPLLGWHSVGILLISSALHAEFSFVFKIMPSIADALSVVLVHRLGRLSPL